MTFLELPIKTKEIKSMIEVIILIIIIIITTVVFLIFSSDRTIYI